MTDRFKFSLIITVRRASCLQSFEKQGFHAGTPAASFSLPSALGSGGPINPPAAAGYAPAPFMHILAPHQQPHSQILHHHLQQDGQVAWMILLMRVSTSTGSAVPDSCDDVHLIPTRTYSSDLYVYKLSYCNDHTLG